MTTTSKSLPTTTVTNQRELNGRVPQKLKVAYIMSRFPKITETFVLFEMLAVEQQGVQVELYPLLREKTDVMHPEARNFVERAHFQPFISAAIVRSHLYYMTRKPRTYFGALWTSLRANLGSPRYFTGILGLFPKTVHFAYLMSQDGVQHVHAHFASHPAAAAFIIHRLSGIPYSFTGHGSDLNRDQHMLREKVADAEFVVPISNYFREMIVEHCGEQYRDKVIVVHCGVDTQVFQPIVTRRPDDPDAPLAIFCVGTLHEVKGQTYLIEACRLLNERGIAFACNFIGDGPDEAVLKQQVEDAGLTDKVTFHGRLTHHRVAELLQGADVLVTPSVPTSDGRREGIPVALMEAMASGLPVVATAISGIPELVNDGQNGFLTPAGNAQAIADALERLADDPALREQFARDGRQKVMDEFDLYKNAATLVKLFSEES